MPGFLEGFAHGLRDGVWALDEAGKTTYVNPAMAGILRCGVDKCLGRPLEEFVVARDAEWLCAVLRNPGGAGTMEADVRLMRGEGSEYRVRVKAVPLAEAVAGEAGAVLVVKDMASITRAEAAQAHLAAIVSSSDDAIISKSLDGTILTWNRGAERVFGYPEAETLDHNITMLLPLERLHEEGDILQRLRNGERIDHFETVRMRKGGEEIDVSVTVSPIIDASGTVVGASKVARDIGERKRIEELQARLAAIVESSDDAIVSKDLNGVVKTWNGGAQRLFGYTAEEMVGRNILTLLPPERHQEEVNTLRTLRAGGRVDHFETVRRTKDGRLIDVSITVSPIRDASGRIVGASKVARDISEAAALQRDRQRLHDELEERVVERTMDLQAAVRELEGFTYTVSHDLRTPLRAIDATSLMLLEDHEGCLPPEARDLLQRQSKAARRMGNLIDELLKLSRLARQPLEVGPVDLSESAAQALRNLGIDPAAADNRVEIQEGMQADADRRLIQFVFQNLLENALKFSPPGAPVRVGQRPDGTVWVADEGIGFQMLYVEKMFEPFHRLIPEEAYPGTGIGLTNVKRIVERHGGRVWAESEPGKGATFFFRLP